MLRKTEQPVSRNREIESSLLDLIRGDGVRRASHELVIDGLEVAGLFRTLMAREGYRETQIDDVAIMPGERVPAFYIAAGHAHFGWIFWEVFSPERRRKIYGSAARNSKGDWAILLGRTAVVWADTRNVQEMDVDRPASL